jgi:hypothetical protein
MARRTKIFERIFGHSVFDIYIYTGPACNEQTEWYELYVSNSRYKRTNVPLRTSTSSALQRSKKQTIIIDEVPARTREAPGRLSSSVAPPEEQLSQSGATLGVNVIGKSQQQSSAASAGLILGDVRSSPTPKRLEA